MGMVTDHTAIDTTDGPQHADDRQTALCSCRTAARATRLAATPCIPILVKCVVFTSAKGVYGPLLGE